MLVNVVCSVCVWIFFSHVPGKLQSLPYPCSIMLGSWFSFERITFSIVSFSKCKAYESHMLKFPVLFTLQLISWVTLLVCVSVLLAYSKRLHKHKLHGLCVHHESKGFVCRVMCDKVVCVCLCGSLLECSVHGLIWGKSLNMGNLVSPFCICFFFLFVLFLILS